jgi:dUTP pyrophosphatase
MKAKDVKVINSSSNPLPAYETSKAAGCDIRAMLVEPLLIPPNHSAIILQDSR